MAIVSFAGTKAVAENPQQAQTQPVPEMAVATQPQMAVDNQRSFMEDAEWDRAAMSKPWLAIGARTGTKTAEHPEWQGKFIYDNAVAAHPIRAIVLGRTPGYEEDDPDAFKNKKRLARWTTAAAAQASGLPFYPTAVLDLLIECDPGSDLAQFSMLESGGKCYAPALFGVRKKSLNRTIGIIIRDRATWLKGDYANGFYQFNLSLDMGAENPYYFAHVRADGLVSPELREAIRQQFGV